MKFASNVLSFLAAAAVAPVVAMKQAPPAELMKHNLMMQGELPHVEGEDWTSLENGMEFMPAADLSPLGQVHLRRLTDGAYSGNGFEKVFLDGAETYYDEYAQAWRALGFYIDCNYDGDNGGGDCQRLLLWAAYIDEKYEGNGVGEYKYYDRKTDVWDDRACRYEQSSRCVKMDCHLSDTHYSLLGFFKEPNYGEYMEQLFKHEGDCVWTDEEYQFMQSNREVWPEGCTPSGITDQAGNVIYYDLAPSRYGEFNLGLYTDASCIKKYSGNMSVLQFAKNYVCGYANNNGGRRLNANICSTSHTNYNDAKAYLESQGYQVENNCNDDNQDCDRDENQGDIWELASNLEEWNAGFDVWKQCQPCKTYDLTNVVAGYNYERSMDGARYNWTSNAMGGGDGAGGDGDDEEDDGEVFHCHDDAGYDDVNQCMKFATHTKMLTAKWTDIEIAMSQATIEEVPLVKGGSSPAEFFTKAFKSSGYGVTQEQRETTALVFAWLFLIVSAILFGASLFRCKSFKEDADEITEPLMPSEEAVAA